MKIAIATNDRKTVAERTGRAGEFAVYHIENRQIIRIEYRENEHAYHHHHDDDETHHHHGRGRGNGRGHRQHHDEHHHHGHGDHQHDEVVDTLKDVDMLLVHAVGKYMRQDLTNGRIPFQRVKGKEINEVLQNYLENLSS